MEFTFLVLVEIPKIRIKLLRFELTITTIEYQYLKMSGPSEIWWSHYSEFSIYLIKHINYHLENF
jgi:hypothetical protein